MIKLDKENITDIAQMSLTIATALFVRLTLGIFGDSMVKSFKLFIQEKGSKLGKNNG